MIDDDTRQRAVAWLERAEDLLADFSDHVEPSILDEARRLAGFGEGPIGLGLVGWSIADGQLSIPRHLIVRLLELTEGSVVPGIDIPDNLLAFAID